MSNDIAAFFQVSFPYVYGACIEHREHFNLQSKSTALRARETSRAEFRCHVSLAEARSALRMSIAGALL